MDYRQALTKLEGLLETVELYRDSVGKVGVDAAPIHKKLCTQYGEVEEVIARILGDQGVEVPVRGTHQTAHYKNNIEAAFFSSVSWYEFMGYSELLKVIGRVRQLAEDPSTLPEPQSVTKVIQILNRFRECCQYVKEPPKDEKEVKDILWIMVRSNYDRVDREDTLPKFGAKAYVPDFGIPDLQLLIEAKYIGEKTNTGDIQEEIFSDIPGYLQDRSRYSSIVVFVYDAAGKLCDPRKFIEDVRKVEGIMDVIVIPGLPVRS